MTPGFLVGLVAGLLVPALLFVILQLGYANAIDWMALRLHGHALQVRARHDKHTRVANEAWVKQYEQAGERA